MILDIHISKQNQALSKEALRATDLSSLSDSGLVPQTHPLRSHTTYTWFIYKETGSQTSDLPSMRQQCLLLYSRLHLFPDVQFCLVSVAKEAMVGILRRTEVSNGRCV